MRKFIEKNRYEILLVVQAAIVNMLVYYGGKLLSRNLPHRCFATGLDAAIPLLPWTILIYFGGVLFWIVNLFIGAGNRKGGHSPMIAAHVLGEAVCFLFFVCLPTTMARPEVTGTGLCDWILRLTYRLDAADNLLPSIHCFESWLCWIEARKNPRVPRWYRWVSLAIAVAICVSTLTVKQHVLADVAAGILLAEVCYLGAERFFRARAAGKQRASGPA